MVGHVCVYAATSDGQPPVPAVSTEKQFQKLCAVLGIQQLVIDPLFQYNSLRVQNREALVALLAEASPVSAGGSVFRSEKSGNPMARIRNRTQVMEDPAAQAMVLEEVMADGVVSKRVRENAFRIKLF